MWPRVENLFQKLIINLVNSMYITSIRLIVMFAFYNFFLYFSWLKNFVNNFASFDFIILVASFTKSMVYLLSAPVVLLFF